MNNIQGPLPYKGPLAEFGIKWLGDHTAAEDALRDCLQTPTTERAVQSVLEEHPVLLARALGGGHGRWVIPQKRLGAEHVPDFIVGEKSSLGYEWTLVELESPRRRMFKKPEPCPPARVISARRPHLRLRASENVAAIFLRVALTCSWVSTVRIPA
jgi:hypothetical protein